MEWDLGTLRPISFCLSPFWGSPRASFLCVCFPVLSPLRPSQGDWGSLKYFPPFFSDLSYSEAEREVFHLLAHQPNACRGLGLWPWLLSSNIHPLWEIHDQQSRVGVPGGNDIWAALWREWQPGEWQYLGQSVCWSVASQVAGAKHCRRCW